MTALPRASESARSQRRDPTDASANRIDAPAVALVRPRLEIGGSERLALDAASQMQRHGCRVRLFVPGRLEAPQFSTIADGTVAVEEVPTSWPVHLRGRLRAPLAIGRTAAAARALARGPVVHDLVICDVVSHVVPLLKRRTGRPVVFFCHFPDRFLTPEGGRASLAYRAYRWPLDRIEAAGMLAADRVIVNSAFTAAKTHEAFPALRDDMITVVHPGVAVSRECPTPVPRDVQDVVLLSVSRFDPRKKLELAIEALAKLRQRLAPSMFERVRLVLAGAYDESLPEQTILLRNLQALAGRLGLAEQVAFVLSPSSADCDRLIARCRAVIYTPSAEHFGYVPLEAMAAGRPVVAADYGGPTETVIHGRTGLLCPSRADAYAEAMATLVMRDDTAQRLGSAGRAHVEQHFTVDAFGRRLWEAVSPFLAGSAVRNRV